MIRVADARLRFTFVVATLLMVHTSEVKITAVVGSNVRLECNTKVDADVSWRNRLAPTADYHEISTNGKILNGYRKRFSVDNSTQNARPLTINEVQQQDAGYYECVGNNGDGLSEITYHLVVLSESNDLDATTENLPVSSTRPEEPGHHSKNADISENCQAGVLIPVVVAIVIGSLLVEAVVFVVLYLLLRRHQRRVKLYKSNVKSSMTESSKSSSMDNGKETWSYLITPPSTVPSP